MDKILPIGTETPYGRIEAIGSLSGERYYWMIDKHKVVSMIPASILEEELTPDPQPR